MEELNDAIEELKRVDHLVYVSLKYTRTVDVLRSVVERLISAFEFATSALLEFAKNKKKITNYHKSPIQNCEAILKLFSGDILIKEAIQLYLKLRKLIRAEYTKREEYRRHVTMIATLDDGEVEEVDIDILKEHYDKTKEFIKYIKGIIEGEND